MSSDLKHLKLTAPGYEKFVGPIGRYEFVDGVSVEPVPENERRRLAAAIAMVEINEDGTEEDASVSARIISMRTYEVEPVPEMKRQSEDDKTREKTASVWLSAPPVETMTLEGIQNLFSKGGGVALRELAVKWNVKHRSFIVLMQMIADKMEDSRAERRAAFSTMSGDELHALVSMRPDLVKDIYPELVRNAESAAKVDPTDDASQVTTETADLSSDAENSAAADAALDAEAAAEALAQAAATGDLGAALNQGE